MVIDTHTHLLPDEVVQNRRRFLRRDEAFRLLYGNDKALLVHVQELLDRMHRERVNQSVVCGFPWEDPVLCREGNDFLWDCSTRHHGQLLPFFCFSLRSPRAAEKEIERCLNRGFAGIGELAFYRGNLSARNLQRLAGILKPLSGTNIPVLLHANEPVGHEYPGKIKDSLRPLYQLLRALPEVTFIFAHWGGGFLFYELMPEVARAAAHTYYDTAASPFLYRPSIYSLALGIIGPKRILFGSDYPLLNPRRYFREMAETPLSAKVRAQIKGLNAQRLFAKNPRVARSGKIGYNNFEGLAKSRQSDVGLKSPLAARGQACHPDPG